VARGAVPQPTAFPSSRPLETVTAGPPLPAHLSRATPGSGHRPHPGIVGPEKSGHDVVVSALREPLQQPKTNERRTVGSGRSVAGHGPADSGNLYNWSKRGVNLILTIQGRHRIRCQHVVLPHGQPPTIPASCFRRPLFPTTARAAQNQWMPSVEAAGPSFSRCVHLGRPLRQQAFCRSAMK